MRTIITGDITPQSLIKELSDQLPRNSYIQLMPFIKKDIVIMATKESHVLGDLLLRHMEGELNVNIKAVISNHDHLRKLVEKFELPYHYIPTESMTREQHETQVKKVIKSYDPSIIVLAKYMRILTPSFVTLFAQSILNIHHSFLPAFIGANPYKQAYKRGVKIIGATAHIVTSDLDEGPIIFQDTTNVDHSYKWTDMRAAGRDVEKIVLAKALELLAQDKVIIYQGKTIIL